MKPNFALSLSFEGIRLLHRAAGGWRTIGDVPFDADDLPGELEILRKTAAALEAGGVRSKVLIPNDQIKYLTIETADVSDAERLTAAHSALEGATPYAVDDLAFDISSEGGKTHIAAVARETLAEAEAFATEHRFYPVSFVAQPEPGAFLGEPFFGPSDAAAKLLDPDEAVEPDDDAVVILGPYIPPKEPEVAQAGTQLDLLSEPPQADTVEVEVPAVEAVPTPEAIAPPEVSEEAAKVVKAPQAPVAKPAPEQEGPVAKAPAVSTAAVVPPAKHLPPATPPKVTTPQAPADPPKAPATVVSAKPEPAPGVVPEQAAKVEAPTAFASRRTATAPAVGSATRTTPAPAPPPAPAPAVAKSKVAEPAIPAPDSRSLVGAPVAKTKASKLGFLSRRKPRKTPPPPAAVAPAVAKSTGSRSRTKAASEAEQMTVFGARKSSDVGGKPRFLGLLLTAALLIFLAGVAAWASVFMDDGISLSRLFGSRDTTAVASLPQPKPDTELVAPKSVTPQAGNDRVASLDPDLTDEDGAVLDALRVPELVQPRVLTQQEIEAKYATTGIWVQGPETPTAPAMVSLDDLYLTSIDPVSTSNDAVALPTLASFGGDLLELSPSSPAAPGTTFTLDDSGMVVPTPDGTVNPDGILVIAGRPPVVPPQTLTRAAQAPAPGQIRPELIGFRPTPRPEGLVENNERSNLDGLTRNELAGLRPQLRPASVQQIAAAVTAAVAPQVDAATAAVGASLAAIQATPPKPAGPVLNNATRYAVPASLRPDPRPRNFDRIVKRAVRAEPQPTQVASTASVAPRTVAPSLPSKASVAKQATVKNAIKLRDINLIGVYGKPSSRRALIRLSNGRYQKVAVGDKLDGGRVSAIGEGELRYTRRGRDVVLKMPRG